MNETNSKQEKLSLVYITRAHKISAPTPLVLTRVHVHKVPWNRIEIWKGKFGE